MKKIIENLKKAFYCDNDAELGEMFQYGRDTIAKMKRDETTKLTNAFITIDLLLSEIESPDRRQHIAFQVEKKLAEADAREERSIKKRNGVKKSVLTPFKDQIKEYLHLSLPLGSIAKIINGKLENPIAYNSFRYFVLHDEELKSLWRDV